MLKDMSIDEKRKIYLCCRIVEIKKNMEENYYGEIAKLINLYDYNTLGKNVYSENDVEKIDELLSPYLKVIQNNSADLNNIFNNADLVCVG